MLICGIDEAGRGPVIGDLVICGVVIDEKQSSELQKLGVKDSKLLSPKKREELFNKITQIVKKYKLIIIDPKEIDEAVNNPNLNLNNLEAVKAAMIVNALAPDKVIIDSPSPNLRAYKEVIQLFVTVTTEIVTEHKAERHPVVAAASILAKVTRDQRIEVLKNLYGDFGSGYPSDPKTKVFLRQNYKKYPEIFRQSWAPYKRLAQLTLR